MNAPQKTGQRQPQLPAVQVAPIVGEPRFHRHHGRRIHGGPGADIGHAHKALAVDIRKGSIHAPFFGQMLPRFQFQIGRGKPGRPANALAVNDHALQHHGLNRFFHIQSPAFQIQKKDHDEQDRDRSSGAVSIAPGGVKVKQPPGHFPGGFQSMFGYSCTASSAGATAPAAAMISAASAEVAKSKNFCAVSDSSTPSLVTKTKGRCTT